MMVGGKMRDLAQDNSTEKVDSMLSPAQPKPPSPETFPFSATISPFLEEQM